ncbi:hypothetical protein B0H11DRAFT_2251681 [Mycena galericulata]|nr:hypothetical protein B0H11DRAFT_2251681 [Mycena galericulata]
MTFTLVLDPQLHPEDAIYAQRSPISEAFQEKKDQTLTRTQLPSWLDELVAQLRSSDHWPFWEEIVHGWGRHCLHVDLLSVAATHLFIRVLWRQSPYTSAQEFTARCIPRKINVLDSLVEDDATDSGIETESEDEYADSEPENTKPFGKRPRPHHRLKPAQNLDGSLRPPSIILTNKTKKAWCDELENHGVLRFVLEKWVDDLNLNPDMGRLLQQMKAVRPSIYKTSGFRDLFQARLSGLAAIFALLCNPENDFETAPHLAESYRLRQWRRQLNSLRTSWSPPAIYLEIDWENVPKKFQAAVQVPSGPPRAANFLRVLSQNPWLIPEAASPSSVFFLFTRPNFLTAWESWIYPGLQRIAYGDPILDDLPQWDPGKLYQELVGLQPKALASWAAKLHISLHPDITFLFQATTNYRAALKEIVQKIRNPSLPTGKAGKDKRRQYHARRMAAAQQATTVLPDHPVLASAASEAPSTSDHLSDEALYIPFEQNPLTIARLHQDCPHCQHYDNPEDKCVRIWYVDRRNVDHLLGCVVSDAPVDDRLEPKNLDAHGYGGDNSKWKTVQELQMKPLWARDAPHLLEGCCRDITLLVDRVTQKQAWFLT